tara:strand:- start:3 stop:635 length:633 start_codon:yes stop_codon:yes gene_type:complete
MTLIKLKKAAMFGLDARIALAIFGALSVISGAALYSAIQNAKSEQARQILNEILKASEAYYLDNGSPLPQSDDYRINTSDLLVNRESLSSWQGPYLSADVNNDRSFKNSLTKTIDPSATIGVRLSPSSTWALNNAYQKCTAVGNDDCAEWVYLYNGNTASGRSAIIDLFNKLDSLIDDGDGDKAGNLRALDHGSNFYEIMYKGMPRKRTI